jgi:hypothetical protein
MYDGRCRKSMVRKRRSRGFQGAVTRLHHRPLNHRNESTIQVYQLVLEPCRRALVVQWRGQSRHSRLLNRQEDENDPVTTTKYIRTIVLTPHLLRHTDSGDINPPVGRSYSVESEGVLRSVSDSLLASRPRAHFNHLRLAKDAGDGLCVNAPMDSVSSPRRLLSLDLS